MKAIDLLKYLDKADPKYVEEASDYQILLLRKRQKRTRVAVAACVALMVLTGALFAKPALYAWETRNTVTSWPASMIHIPGTHYGAETSPLYVSAEMPDQKRMDHNIPFTLSVGLGQVSDYEYATLSVKAYGFEITDKEGNTVTDRYVRTLSDFNGGDYGVTYGSRHNVTGCSYLEDFTLRYVGSENTTGWGVIEFSLRSGDQSSSVGDAVTVYYTIRDGVLKLTDKNPVRDGSQNGGMATVLHPEEETESGTVTLSKEDISIRVDMPSGALTHGEFIEDKFRITAFHIPTQKDYPTDQFTAELICAETLRQEDFSFTIKRPIRQNGDGSMELLSPRVPDDAPVGSYDLAVTDLTTGFVWTFENATLILPADIPAIEDFTFESFPFPPSLRQGDYWPSGGWEPFTLTLNGEGVEYQCFAYLQYAGEEESEYTIEILGSLSSSHASPAFIPCDAPVGMYDLCVTHEVYGYTWRSEQYLEITENPHAELFGLYHSMGTHLRVSLSSDEIYTFVAKLENRGAPFTVTETNDSGFRPEAMLTGLEVPGGASESIPLRAVTGPDREPYEWTVRTGATMSQPFEILLDPDTACGLYDLVLSYGDCVRVFEDVVEVVP